MSTEKRTINGGCHCGHIRYTFAIQPQEDGKFHGIRCNCTFCTKLAASNIHGKPEDFKLLSPASLDDVSNYAPRVKSLRRNFCNKCGVHVWMAGSYPHGEMEIPIFAVNLATIDQPQEGIKLNEVVFGYYDMLHSNFEGGLAEKPWECGLV